MADEAFQKPDLSNARTVDLSQVRLVPPHPWEVAQLHIDGEFQRVQADLIREHQRQEERQSASLQWKAEAHHARDLETASNRYNTRLHIIDRRYERMALSLRDRHNSVRGRLQALTKEGRSYQESQRTALRVRAGNLRVKVIDRFLDRKLELQERYEASLKMANREIKALRKQHRKEQHRLVEEHRRDRDNRIDAYAQRIREQRAEQTRQQELQRTQTQDRQQSRSS
jgi:hypothetical protein